MAEASFTLLHAYVVGGVCDAMTATSTPQGTLARVRKLCSWLPTNVLPLGLSSVAAVRVTSLLIIHACRTLTVLLGVGTVTQE